MVTSYRTAAWPNNLQTTEIEKGVYGVPVSYGQLRQRKTERRQMNFNEPEIVHSTA